MSIQSAYKTSIISLLLVPLLGLSPQLASSAEELVLQSGKQKNTLIELYTSQGCSSCPPAEHWLGELQKHSDLWERLIPVAFHVDYWDYLGWKDELAAPAFSKRQRQYAREKGLSTVYTPGFIVNGKEWRRWFGLRKIPESDEVTGQLTAIISGSTITASYSPASSSARTLHLNIAIIGIGITADIKRGENRGKVLPQDFSVLAFKQVKSSNRHWGTTLPHVRTEDSERLGIAVWVSRSDRLEPLQAVGGWLQPYR